MTDQHVTIAPRAAWMLRPPGERKPYPPGLCSDCGHRRSQYSPPPLCHRCTARAAGLEEAAA